MKYELKDKIPFYLDQAIISVVGQNAYLYVFGMDCDSEITWRELIEQSIINRRVPRGSLRIIVEEALGGVVYEFGNHDRRYIYECGKTYGYA